MTADGMDADFPGLLDIYEDICSDQVIRGEEASGGERHQR
jgi:hypothetical protein